MLEWTGDYRVFLIVLFSFSAQPDHTDREDLTLEVWNSSINSIWKFEIHIFLRFTYLCLIKNKVWAYNICLEKENLNWPFGKWHHSLRWLLCQFCFKVLSPWELRDQHKTIKWKWLLLQNLLSSASLFILDLT